VEEGWWGEGFCGSVWGGGGGFGRGEGVDEAREEYAGVPERYAGSSRDAASVTVVGGSAVGCSLEDGDCVAGRLTGMGVLDGW